METNECRIMSAYQHASYMDNNSNVCISDPDHGLVSLDPDGVGSNTHSADQTANSEQLRKQGVEKNWVSQGNIIEISDKIGGENSSESSTSEYTTSGVTQVSGNILYDYGGNNDGDNNDKGDEALSSEKLHPESPDESGGQSCLGEEIRKDDKEVDEVDYSPRTACDVNGDEVNCDKKSDAEMRCRLTSGSKRNAFLLDDFDVNSYSFESNTSHIIEGQLDDDEGGAVERVVSALEPRERHSTVADNESEPNSDKTEKYVRDQWEDNMDTKPKRGQHKNKMTMKISKRADDRSVQNPICHTCLVCFRERMAALGVSSKYFDNFIATSPITATMACSSHAGEHRKPLDPPVEVCGTSSEHPPIKTAERLQPDSDAEDNDNQMLTGSDRCKNSFMTAVANDLISSKTIASRDPVPPETRERCDAPKAMTDISGLVVDMLREFVKRLEFERQQRERAEDWAEFLMLELDAQIEARSEAEEGREAVRQRTIRLVAKYKKLKSEHANLVSQIRAMSMPDTVEEKRRDCGSSLLRRKKKSSTNRESLLSKRNAIMVRHSGRRQSSGESDNSCSESFSDGKENAGFILKNLEDVKCKWQSQCGNSERQSGDIMQSEEINVKNSDIAILNESVTDQNEFNASCLPTTSTPVREWQRLVLDESRASELSSASRLATVGADGNGCDVILVNVKASANMWEQMLQKKAGMKASVRNVSSSQEPVSGMSPLLQGMCIRDVKEFHKCLVENSRTSDSGVHCGSDRKFSHSGGSEDDDLSDLEYLSANEEFGKSAEILTDSINAKETRQMWECLSSSNTRNSSPEPSKSPKPIFSSGVIEQVKAKFETASESANNNSIHSELTLHRSTNFSSLRSQWEDKGKY